MADHPTAIPGFDTLKDAAEFICNLRYDALQEFAAHMERKLLADSRADRERNRLNLCYELGTAGSHMYQVAMAIGRAWIISEPYMRENPPGG